MNSVDKQDLSTVVDELGKGFADGGEDLQRLIDSGDALTKSATEALPETIKLIDDGRIVLDTQRDTAGDVKVFAKNFADLSETLKASDGDLRLILDRGVGGVQGARDPDQGQPGQPRGPARQPDHRRPGDHLTGRRASSSCW